MEKQVTFIVKATNDVNRVMRCLASIDRQNNKNYKVIALCSLKEAKLLIEEQYPHFEVKKIKKAVSFVENLNKVLPTLETEYCVIVNYDEILSPDAVDLILSSDSDVVLFNISSLTKDKFSPRYSTSSEWSVAEYMKEGYTLWNNAIKSEIIVKHNITLEDLTYCSQSIFLLLSYSFAESFTVFNTVIAYREKLMKKKHIEYKEFEKHLKALKAIVKRFTKKKMFDEKECVVTDFALSQLGEVYKEESFFRRLRKKRLLKTMIGI